jgi:CRISPR-associated protein Cas6
MYWQDDTSEEDVEIPEDVIDLLFSISCKSLPIDHGQTLAQAIIEILPWIANESQAAVHQIHVAESSHGWQRPEEDLLLPSRRTKLVLRMPSHRLDDCRALIDQTLDIDGHDLKVEASKSRPLSKLTTIFARYIETSDNEADDEFMRRLQILLKKQKIDAKKMMSGRVVKHITPEGPLCTRKLMLSGLSVEDSLYLQQWGLGDKMLMGIGIFLPHKGIDAVNPG